MGERQKGTKKTAQGERNQPDRRRERITAILYLNESRSTLSDVERA